LETVPLIYRFATPLSSWLQTNLQNLCKVCPAEFVERSVKQTGASAVEFEFNLSDENRLQEAKAKIPLDECFTCFERTGCSLMYQGCESSTETQNNPQCMVVTDRQRKEYKQ